MKIKITAVGQACRHCGTPVELRNHKPGWKPKPASEYWYTYWFGCPKKGCRAIYLVDAAKVVVNK